MVAQLPSDLFHRSADILPFDGDQLIAYAIRSRRRLNAVERLQIAAALSRLPSPNAEAGRLVAAWISDSSI